MSENQTTNEQTKKMTYREPIIIPLPHRQSWWKRWCCFPWKHLHVNTDFQMIYKTIILCILQIHNIHPYVHMT